MTTWQDIRYAIRMLAKRLDVTISALLILALGIGASSAILTLLHSVILAPLPFSQPEKLVRVYEEFPKFGWSHFTFSWLDYVDFRARAQSFDEVGGYKRFNYNLTGHDRPELLAGAMVSSSFWRALRVAPQAGRMFTPDEDRAGVGERVAVLSDAAWQRLFQRDPRAIGATIVLNDTPYIVVGVTPRDFLFINAVDVWTPLAPALANNGRGNHDLTVIARMKPEVSIAAAGAEVASIAAQFNREFADSDAGEDISLLSFNDWFVASDFRRALWLLAGAVGFVLLICCSNVANLMLLRATERRGEMAVRLALGANASRLVRQLLTESVLLALAGGALGMLAGVWCVQTLKAFGGTSIPRLQQVAPDIAVFATTFGIALLCGLFFGVMPALRGTRVDLVTGLKTTGRGGSNAGGKDSLRSLLVVAEVALSLILFTGAGLLIRSYRLISEKGPGFSAENLIAARINLPRARYKEDPAILAALNQLEERFLAIPGVRSAGYTSAAPFRDGATHMELYFDGQSTSSSPNSFSYRSASVGYLESLGVPLIEGRLIAHADTEKSELVVVASREFARRFLAGRDPIGQTFHGGDPSSKPVTIVGVVGDASYEKLESAADPMVYYPASQMTWNQVTFLVRSNTEPESVIPAMRQALNAQDPTLPLIAPRSMAEDLSTVLTPRKFNLLLLGSFAALGIILALIGIFGVMSYGVARRKQEFGIRIALGAQPADILRLTLRHGLSLVATGLAIGIAGGLALTRLMSGMLYGVQAQDPLTYISVSALFTAVALIACWIPSWRATQVDPNLALKYE